MANVLRGANVTAQWYQDEFLGALFGWLEKAVLHLTVTADWPGYKGGASAPNATYKPAARAIRQHFENNRSARALRDPDSTPVRENRDRVWQLEIIAYPDRKTARANGGICILDLTDAHYTDIAWMLIQLHHDLGLPLQSMARWPHEGTQSYYNDVRLTSAQFDAYRGWLGHCHVSGNEHWDPCGFFASKLKAKIAQLVTPGPPPIPLPPKPVLMEEEMSTVVIKVGGSRFKLADLESGRVAHGLSETGAVALSKRFGVIVALNDADWVNVAAALDTPAEIDLDEPDQEPDPEGEGGQVG